MWAQGQIDEAGIEPVLVLLSVRNAAGTLTVQSEEDVVAVRFRDGMIVGADALRQSFSEGLGRVLVEEGLLDPSGAQRVEDAELDGTVEDYLSSSQLVADGDLGRCVREHAYRVLRSLLTWRAGEYQFYEGETSRTRGTEPLEVEEVLVRISEDDAVGREPVPPLSDEVLRPALQGRTFRVLGWEEEPAALRSGDVWLTPFEDALLRSLDGLTPARRFQDSLGVDEYRLRYALDRLRKTGLVEAVPTPGDDAGSMRRDVAAPPSVAAPQELVEEAPRAASEWRQARTRDEERLAELRALLSDLSRGFGGVLAAGLAVLLLVLVLVGDGISYLLLPLPWQAPERRRLEAAQELALVRELSARLKTYHTLYGSFPLDFRPLVDTHLLSSRDLRDGKGREVVLQTFEQGYSLAVKEEGEEAAGGGFRFDVEGDFLLDPDFTVVETPVAGSPLRLVD